MNIQLRKIVPAYFRFLVLVYGTGIALFTVPRIILLWQNSAQTAAIPTSVLLKALWMGFRFDTVVSGYLLAVPFVVLALIEFFDRRSRWPARIVAGYLSFAYGLAFLACGADIPFFNHFNARLNMTIFTWKDTPGFVAKMIFQDVRFYPYWGLFIGMTTLFSWAVFRYSRQLYENNRPHKRHTPTRRRRMARATVFLLLGALLLIMGIRGRLAAKSPIRWGTAFFSTYAFANQLGLNPAFTLARSWLDSRKPENQRVHFMADEEAIARVQKYLGITPDSAFASPIARRVHPTGAPRHYNVVVVLMENMAAWKMGIFGNPHRLTPHLDSLARAHSALFTRFYSAGIHTYNGVYSTLFGFPALMEKHSMKTVESMQPFTGLARTLSDHGYRTIFFTTHDEQFDNMGGFLSFNGFQTIISQKDYPPEKILSTLGVPDHYLFEFSLPYLNRLHQTGEPFLAVYLTASDHGPYIIPEDIPFQPHSREIKQQIVEYADWSIGRFLAAARRQPWYSRTIFVFLADHGTLHTPVYDLDLSFHHIPLIIHSPALFPEAQRLDAPGGQIDVFPTIMGLLNLPYVNNTLGIDLWKEKRPYIYFSADDKLGCLNGEFLWVWRRNGGESLYRYLSRDRTDYVTRFPQIAQRMRSYAQSMLQATQWLISRRLVGPEPVSQIQLQNYPRRRILKNDNVSASNIPGVF
ncbi:MAG: alkaline phosphatase family protein [Calditrichaeota bacterium]|nr:MAG: alkaline phosphatase family protein [Calditrichota bacterium]